MIVQSKMIVHVAKEIINQLYMMLDEESTKLVVTANIDDLAKGINVTGKQIRLSLYYLREMGYITIMNGSFDLDCDIAPTLSIHPGVIDKMENNRVFK